jgi:hypothetical protein
MDCSTIEERKHSDDESSIVPITTSTRIISVCEVQPSFYLTTPIRRLFDPDMSPSRDQSTPNSSLVSVDYKTPSLNDFQHLEYSDNEDENNKENNHYSSTLTEIQNPTEVKKSSIFKLILKNPLYTISH